MALNGGTGEQVLPVPLMPGFKRQVLPVLVVYWLLSVALATLGQPAALVVGAWATVTTIMMWPVGRQLGRAYKSYRTTWFVIGVLSMLGIPAFGYLMIDSTQPAVKLAALIALAIDIGLWGIPASTRSAFSNPVRMLFRPDLIFGDGRILAGGIVAIGFGIKFVFSDMPPGNIPNGNWYALFLVIVLALVQIIPLRGMWKMRNRISRVLFDRWESYAAVAAKELYLLLAVVALMFGFHNFYGGVTPFTRNVLAGSEQGFVIMVAFGLFIVLARSYYKKYEIGDPFITESFGQGLVKHSILAVGLIGFMYGYLNVMLGGFPKMPNVGNNLYLSILGVMMILWGVTLLVPLRAWAQSNQRRAMMRQMVEVILPALNDNLRLRAMRKIVGAVARLPEARRLGLVTDMLRFLGEMTAADREKVMKTQLEVLSSLEPDERIGMMKAMDYAMAHS